MISVSTIQITLFQKLYRSVNDKYDPSFGCQIDDQNVTSGNLWLSYVFDK